MLIFGPYSNIQWYAQTSTKLYSASQIKDFSTGEIEKPTNEEFKSDEFLCAQKLSTVGIYRYGVTNGLASRDKFIDFYVMNEDYADFHYKTKEEDLDYNISLLFSWSTAERLKRQDFTVDNFSKYLTLSKNQKKLIPIKINDIFVQKFGHMDIVLGQQQEMSHDGSSVGFKVKVNFDEIRSAEITIRGNIDFKKNNEPFFQINILPNFDCTVHVDLHTNDTQFKTTSKHQKLVTNQSSTIFFERQNPAQEEEIALKNDYKNIARFIDWNSVPKGLQVDWENDDIDTIGKKFLMWSDYLKNKPKEEDQKLIDTVFFTIYHKPNYPIIYHNNPIRGKVGILVDHPCLGIPVSLLHYLPESIEYQYNLHTATLIIKGCLLGFKYTLEIFAKEHTTAAPKLKLTLLTKPKEAIRFKVDSDFVYKDAEWHEYELDNETLVFETK